MILQWTVATLAGLFLGLAWYGCVRLRMYLGPIIRERYGNIWRKAYWVLTILVMILLANGGLMIVRGVTGESPGALKFEIWFAGLALTIAFGLIVRRLRRKP